MLLFDNRAISEGLMKCFDIQESLFVPLLHLSSISAVMLLLFYLAAFLLCLLPENNYRRQKQLSPATALLAVLAFFFAFIHLGGESVFVYFNF